MASRLLPPVLASLALLGPFAIHLFFPLIPVLKAVFELTNAQAYRASIEKMIVLAASIAVAATAVQSTLLLSGHLTPLVLFLPGTFITLAQGLSLPFAQAGAMATIPRLAGTAAGIGVFAQNFFGAGFAQLYGLLADGTQVPMVEIMTITVGLGFVAASVPWLLKGPPSDFGSSKPLAYSEPPYKL
jgi:DHA1 family bicyclomycin/chloramphenicol resistance-like MFS transporter